MMLLRELLRRPCYYFSSPTMLPPTVAAASLPLLHYFVVAFAIATLRQPAGEIENEMEVTITLRERHGAAACLFTTPLTPDAR